MPYQLNIGVGLPAYARLDLAYESLVNLSLVPATTKFEYLIQGDNIGLILSACFTLTSDATVGNRQVFAVGLDSDGNRIWAVPSAAFQTAAQQVTYSWLAGIAVAYAPGGLQSVMPLPATPLYPGNLFRVSVIGAAAGDTFTTLELNVLQIPTGPYDAPQTAPLAPPTLLLV